MNLFDQGAEVAAPRQKSTLKCKNVIFATVLGLVVLSLFNGLTFNAIYVRAKYERIRAERIDSLLQMELEVTERKLESGVICEGQLVVDYLALSDPCKMESFGRYSEFQHGFPGGLGHGVTIVSKDGRLARAYSWSCMGGEEYFNGMTDADSTEFGKLRSWAHPPLRQ